MVYGYTGKILRVDLTREKTSSEPTNMEWARMFLGGKGLGAKYLFELSGEHPSLPLAELRACLDVYGIDCRLEGQGAGYAVCSLPASKLPRIVSRLALSHRVGKYLGSCPERVKDCESEIDDIRALNV